MPTMEKQSMMVVAVAVVRRIYPRWRLSAPLVSSQKYCDITMSSNAYGIEQRSREVNNDKRLRERASDHPQYAMLHACFSEFKHIDIKSKDGY